jgi:hypothetical protein
MKSTRSLVGLTLVIAVALLHVVPAEAGSLTPPATPAPTFHTLSDIYSRLTTNATSTAGNHSFTAPTSVVGSDYTLTQIYSAIPTIDPAKVLQGTNYLGVAGSVPTRTPAATSTSFLSGFYNAFDLSTIDVDLIASNIVDGVNIFGIIGTAVASSWVGTAESDLDMAGHNLDNLSILQFNFGGTISEDSGDFFFQNGDINMGGGGIINATGDISMWNNNVGYITANVGTTLDLGGNSFYMNGGTGAGGGALFMDGGPIQMGNGGGSGGADINMDGGAILSPSTIQDSVGAFIFDFITSPGTVQMPDWNLDMVGHQISGVATIAFGDNSYGLTNDSNTRLYLEGSGIMFDLDGNNLTMNGGSDVGGGTIYMDGGSIQMGAGNGESTSGGAYLYMDDGVISMGDEGLIQMQGSDLRMGDGSGGGTIFMDGGKIEDASEINSASLGNPNGELLLFGDNDFGASLGARILLTDNEMYLLIQDDYTVMTATYSQTTMNGSILLLEGLPQSDPLVADQLWNDGGTLKVSAG